MASHTPNVVSHTLTPAAFRVFRGIALPNDVELCQMTGDDDTFLGIPRSVAYPEHSYGSDFIQDLVQVDDRRLLRLSPHAHGLLGILNEVSGERQGGLEQPEVGALDVISRALTKLGSDLAALSSSHGVLPGSITPEQIVVDRLEPVRMYLLPPVELVEARDGMLSEIGVGLADTIKTTSQNEEEERIAKILEIPLVSWGETSRHA
ncbi:MAG: hypothetical protein AAF413_00035 [Patescibacteria group bacterium]